MRSSCHKAHGLTILQPIRGDVFVTTSYPFIDVARGGSLQGIIYGLDSIIEIMIPDANQEGGTLAIAGHGRIVDEYEVVVYRDMLTLSATASPRSSRWA